MKIKQAGIVPPELNDKIDNILIAQRNVSREVIDEWRLCVNCGRLKSQHHGKNFTCYSGWDLINEVKGSDGNKINLFVQVYQPQENKMFVHFDENQNQVPIATLSNKKLGEIIHDLCDQIESASRIVDTEFNIKESAAMLIGIGDKDKMTQRAKINLEKSVGLLPKYILEATIRGINCHERVSEVFCRSCQIDITTGQPKELSSGE